MNHLVTLLRADRIGCAAALTAVGVNERGLKEWGHLSFRELWARCDAPEVMLRLMWLAGVPVTLDVIGRLVMRTLAETEIEPSPELRRLYLETSERRIPSDQASRQIQAMMNAFAATHPSYLDQFGHINMGQVNDLADFGQTMLMMHTVGQAQSYCPCGGSHAAEIAVGADQVMRASIKLRADHARSVGRIAPGTSDKQAAEWSRSITADFLRDEVSADLMLARHGAFEMGVDPITMTGHVKPKERGQA